MPKKDEESPKEIIANGTTDPVNPFNGGEVIVGDGKKRGKVYILDHGIKTFEIEANQRNPEVIIQSKPVSHVEASHTGDKLRESGVELKGYRVKVYLEGSLIYEEEK